MAAQNIYDRNGGYYIKFFKKFHGFPTHESYVSVCDGASVREVAEIPDDEIGFNLSPSSELIKVNEDVYLYTNGKRYLIDNKTDAVSYYQFCGKKNVLTEAGLKIFMDLPEGDTIKAPGTP